MINIDENQCTACGFCALDCMAKIIKVEDRQVKVVNELCLECGHCQAICLTDAVSLVGYDRQEIISYEPDTFTVQAGNLLNFIKFRRSTRRFQTAKVETEKIAAIIEAGRYSPTAGNRQPLRYLVIDSPVVLQEVTDLAISALYNFVKNTDTKTALQYVGGNQFYLDRWIQMKKDYMEKGQDSLFYKAPLVICLVGTENDRLDGGIAASNMELIANALGLGACFIGYFGRAVGLESELSKFLGLAAQEKIITTLALGYSGLRYLRTVNRKPAQVTRF